MKIKDINSEINQLIRAGDKSPLDKIRYKYLNEIQGLFQDKIILSYYSNLNNPEDIIEDDIKSFINLLDEDNSKGIVLIITSNGGDLTAVERIMNYIQKKYNNNIEVIIPQIAMSAATVMSLSSKNIYMSEYSCLGPIDPQIRFNNAVLSGHTIISSINQAKKDLQNNENEKYWDMELKKYPPGIEQVAMKGIKLSETIAEQFLKEVMFSGINEDEFKNKSDQVKDILNASDILAHNRKLLRFNLEGILKIKRLEDNMRFYTSVINYHHAINITFERAPHVTKIIETSNSESMVRSRAVQNQNGQIQGNEKAPRQNIPN